MKHAETLKLNLMYSDTGFAKITLQRVNKKSALIPNTWTPPSQSNSTAGHSADPAGFGIV